jgi:integrase
MDSDKVSDGNDLQQKKAETPNPDTTAQNRKSEKEVRKQFSRFSAGYWKERLFRPTYRRSKKTFRVSEWYVQIQFGGRREKIGLGTNNQELAAGSAANLYGNIRTKGWAEALKKFSPDRYDTKDRTTVGAHVELMGKHLGVRDATSKKYAYCLRRIASDIAGVNNGDVKKFDPVHKLWQAKADQVKLSVLTPASIEDWKISFIQLADQTKVAQLAARRNVNYFVRNARSLFGKKLQQRFRDLKLPDFVNPFHGVRLENEGSKRYVSSMDAQQLLKKGRKDLSEKDPNSWKVVLLALGAGLRRAEIDGLSVPQVDFRNAKIRVTVHDHFEAKTDESIGAVDVDQYLLAELKANMDFSKQFVVEPDTPGPKGARAPGYYRCDGTFTRVIKWLHDNGVSGDRPIHILRKEFGSIINAQSDIHAASSQLRHSNIATTSAVYADNRKRSTVAVGKMLGPKAKPRQKPKQPKKRKTSK